MTNERKWVEWAYKPFPEFDEEAFMASFVNARTLRSLTPDEVRKACGLPIRIEEPTGESK